MIAIRLPWPPSALSPNRRLHWARLAKAKAAYRAACCLVTTQATVLRKIDSQRDLLPAGGLALVVEFCPPDRRSYDRDNLAARMKAGWDGMCDALGIDDRRFSTLTVKVGPPTKGGAVNVGIEPC